MDKAEIIYEYLKDRIPGIMVGIGYGSEFDKTEEELEPLKTKRKIDRSMRSHSIVAIPSMIREFNWKKTEDQYDYLIFCDDVKESFSAAMISLQECNTPTTRKFISGVDSKTITEETNVVYMTYVYVEALQRYIKIGFCDYYKTLKSMIDFDSLYIPLRLTKRVYVAKSTPEFDEALDLSRKMVDYITGLIITEDEYLLDEHFMTAYNLSYSGDSRNGIAEDPRKLKKLLSKQEDFLEETYAQKPFYNHFMKCDSFGIHSMIRKSFPDDWFSLLPDSLQIVVREAGLEYSNLETEEEKELLSKTITDYFHKRTSLESKIEPIRGLGSNGVLNSMAYLTRKLTKAHKNH